jgi:hypothetical protein
MPPDNAVVFKRKLSDALIRSLTEPGKHADGEVPGLYLEVRASSKAGKSPSKVWRLKYRLHGKENRFSIGAYPDIGLKEARDIARSARRDVANHTAPLKAKTAKIEAQLLNEERTFAYVAEQWLAFKSAELVTKSISGFNGALNNHILPAIARRRILIFLSVDQLLARDAQFGQPLSRCPGRDARWLPLTLANRARSKMAKEGPATPADCRGSRL